MADSILSLDVGTSSIHCMIASELMTPVATAEAPIRYFTPVDASDLTREFDPQEVMSTADRLVADTLRDSSTEGKDIKAIGVTGQRQGVIFLDSEGNELLTSPNLDLRAAFEGASIDETFGSTIASTTGHFPSLLLAPARLRWIQNNMPDIAAQIRHLLTIPGWMVYRLTGKTACEPSLAAATGLLDISTRRRPEALMEQLAIPESLLAPLTQAGDVAGILTHQMAERWGIPAGTPVTLAGADTQCGLLGMGLASHGDTGAIAGWSCSLQMISRTPCYDDTMNSWTGCYPIDDMWVAESNLGDAGNAHRWLKETLTGYNSRWEEVSDQASKMPIGSNGVLCYLGPSPGSAAQAGLGIGGLIFPTPLSYQEPSPGLLMHAFWESLAYSLKANHTSLEAMTGFKSDYLYMGGGLAQSDGLIKIIADTLNKSIWRSDLPQVSCLGAAAAAAVAAGLAETISGAAKAIKPKGHWTYPDPQDNLDYEDHYLEWVASYDKLQGSRANIE